MRVFRLHLQGIRGRLPPEPAAGTPAGDGHDAGNHVDVTPALERVGDSAAFLGETFDKAMTYAALRKAEGVGRPVGSKIWLADMEKRTGLTLAVGKRGLEPKSL